MNSLKQFFNSIFRSTEKPQVEPVVEKTIAPQKDKVAHFNKVAPQLFAPQLKELGYELTNIENYESSGILWSTKHYYENKNLNLTLKIEQAPYYTDYGFSIFLCNDSPNNLKLLCNVPHELQDNDDNYLVNMRDRFFAHAEIIALLKGEIWRPINHLRNESPLPPAK